MPRPAYRRAFRIKGALVVKRFLAISAFLCASFIAYAANSQGSEADRLRLAENFNTNAASSFVKTHTNARAEGTVFRVASPITIAAFNLLIESGDSLIAICAGHIPSWGEETLNKFETAGFNHIAFDDGREGGTVHVCAL